MVKVGHNHCSIGAFKKRFQGHKKYFLRIKLFYHSYTFINHFPPFLLTKLPIKSFSSYFGIVFVSTSIISIRFGQLFILNI